MFLFFETVEKTNFCRCDAASPTIFWRNLGQVADKGWSAWRVQCGCLVVPRLAFWEALVRVLSSQGLWDGYCGNSLSWLILFCPAPR